MLEIIQAIETMNTLTKLGLFGAVAVASIGFLCNLPTNPFVKSPEKATLEYLASTKLSTFGMDPKEFLEAQGLSSLKPDLDTLGVPLYAVVHEDLGVDEFRPFFKGDIFLDKERRFYGPVERRMLWSGLLRLSVISRIWNTKKKGIHGNLKGEGRILGGVFVIGSGDSGILMEHREHEFGDYANLTQVLAAAMKIGETKI